MLRLKRHRHSSYQATGSEINISPLIDIIFILLIFFVVTTVFSEQTGIEVNKPIARSTQELEKKAILIAVSSSGEVYQGGRIIGVDGVNSVVSALLEGDDSMPVIIHGDKETTHGVIFEVIDAAKLAGAKSVHLASTQ